MVFQSFALLPWLTVQQNAELGLIARGIPARSPCAEEFGPFRPTRVAKAAEQGKRITRNAVDLPKL